MSLVAPYHIRVTSPVQFLRLKCSERYQFPRVSEGLRPWVPPSPPPPPKQLSSRQLQNTMLHRLEPAVFFTSTEGVGAGGEESLLSWGPELALLGRA